MTDGLTDHVLARLGGSVESIMRRRGAVYYGYDISIPEWFFTYYFDTYWQEIGHVSTLVDSPILSFFDPPRVWGSDQLSNKNMRYFDL